MNQNDFINGIIIQPQFKVYAKEPSVIRGAVRGKLPRAINRVVARYPFKFATAITDVSGDSVSGQSDYSCPGSDDDAMKILSVQYGDNLDKLEKMSISGMEVEMTWVDTSASSVNVYAWARLPNEDGFPKIRLFDSPNDDNDTIRYRYHRKNLPFSEFPEEWLYVLEDSILACMNMDNNLEVSLKEMIEAYDPSTGNPMSAKISKYYRNRNIERNREHGY